MVARSFSVSHENIEVKTNALIQLFKHVISTIIDVECPYQDKR